MRTILTCMILALLAAATTTHATTNHDDFIGEWHCNTSVPTGMDSNGTPATLRISVNQNGEPIVLIGGLQASVANKTTEQNGAATLRGDLNNGTKYIITMDPGHGMAYDVYEYGSWHRMYYDRSYASIALVKELVAAGKVTRGDIMPFGSGDTYQEFLFITFLSERVQQVDPRFTREAIAILRDNGIGVTNQ